MPWDGVVRLDWTEDPRLERRGYYSRRATDPIGIAIHNTGGDESIQADNRYHIYKKDWPGNAPHIAYTIWIPRDPNEFLRKYMNKDSEEVPGVYVLCNHLWERSWHATDANDEYVGIALQGNGETEEATDAQGRTLRSAINYLKTLMDVRFIRGHKELWAYNNNTICPGKLYMKLVNAVR